MSNKFIWIICCAMVLSHACSLFSETATSKPSIKWQTNYDEAIKQGKEGSKPVILFFTGSDWCSWCTKLEQEVLSTQEFADAVANKFIFVKLDFPLYSAQDPQVKAQNKQLQQKFDVRSYPTIVIFDAQQNRQIGTTGYRPGGGKQYADYLLKQVNDFSSYKQKMGALDKGGFSGSDLKQLYEQAKKLNIDADATKIVSQGMKSDKSTFFLTERYRQLADEGHIHSKEAQDIRKQLLACDPTNEKHIPYHVAVIEFETYLNEMDKDNYTAELAVAPLKTYIEKYGNKDKEHLWRLEMLISQVYLDKNQMASALKHAQYSYDAAPSSVQPEISKAIQSIRSKIDSASIVTLAH